MFQSPQVSVTRCPGEVASQLETIQRWKINQLFGGSGALWQRDDFDRLVRDEKHLANCVRYIRRNPQKARLRVGEYVV